MVRRFVLAIDRLLQADPSVAGEIELDVSPHDRTAPTKALPVRYGAKDRRSAASRGRQDVGDPPTQFILGRNRATQSFGVEFDHEPGRPHPTTHRVRQQSARDKPLDLVDHVQRRRFNRNRRLDPARQTGRRRKLGEAVEAERSRQRPHAGLGDSRLDIRVAHAEMSRRLDSRTIFAEVVTVGSGSDRSPYSTR